VVYNSSSCVHCGIGSCEFEDKLLSGGYERNSEVKCLMEVMGSFFAVLVN